MKCPMYTDYTRDCVVKIGFLPQTSLDYCETEKYEKCPFFKTINNIGLHCEYLNKCPVFKHFGIHDFEQFVKMTDKYCLSKNRVNCERFKLRKAEKEAPEDLLPDGTKLTNK